MTSESDVPKVVLAIDGSEHAERALQFYLSSLRREGQEVHLVHALEYPYIPAQRTYVSDPMQPMTPYARKDVIQEMFDSARKQGTKLEEKFKATLQEKQIPFKVHSEFANPGEYICKTATDQKATMIVIGTRGMGTIRRTIMGSVSDYVVHHAHCPVMVARH